MSWATIKITLCLFRFAHHHHVDHLSAHPGHHRPSVPLSQFQLQYNLTILLSFPVTTTRLRRCRGRGSHRCLFYIHRFAVIDQLPERFNCPIVPIYILPRLFLSWSIWVSLKALPSSPRKNQSNAVAFCLINTTTTSCQFLSLSSEVIKPRPGEILLIRGEFIYARDSSLLPVFLLINHGRDQEPPLTVSSGGGR